MTHPSRSRFFSKLSVSFVLFFLFVIPLKTYAIHKGAGEIVCGSCHTMHNSQGNQGLGGLADGSLVLLRGNVSSRAEIHKLCLQCHASNGAQANTQHAPQNVTAPKVWSTAPWTSDDPFNRIGAGGNFSTELDQGWSASTTNMLGYGHSLGAANIIPPGGDNVLESFSCTNCHDPHGTASETDSKVNLFRNLRVNATGAGNNSGVKFPPNSDNPNPDGYYKFRSYVGGVNGTYFGGSETDNGGSVIWPIYRNTLTGVPAADAPNSNAYGTGPEGPLFVYYRGATMSKWCAQCHDKWHEYIETTNWVADTNPQYQFGHDWRRHPVNAVVPRLATQGCAQNCHLSALDRTNYNNSVITAGKGIPVTASKYYNDYVYYLPECAETGGPNPSCFGEGVEGMDNLYISQKVFCLSCHFAHGGPYYDALRWNYATGVDTGKQTGLGVPSNVGCQLCHNRGG